MVKNVNHNENESSRRGFVKLTSGQRAALIRKGNELFHNGEWEKARRIFVTTRYSDGLIRMGDHDLNDRNPGSAIRMYRMAPAPDKLEPLLEKTASAIRQWLNED